ncbi:MAG: hypothetical protein WB586_01550 [Chthoniobacterales bacterium]
MRKSALKTNTSAWIALSVPVRACRGKRINNLDPAAIVRLGISMAPEGGHVYPFMYVMVVRDIARAIVEINREEGISIILVEQNSRMALKISNRAYALETGRIALTGKSADLLNDSCSRVRRLLRNLETSATPKATR